MLRSFASQLEKYVILMPLSSPIARSVPLTVLNAPFLQGNALHCFPNMAIRERQCGFFLSQKGHGGLLIRDNRRKHCALRYPMKLAKNYVGFVRNLPASDSTPGAWPSSPFRYINVGGHRATRWRRWFATENVGLGNGTRLAVG